MREVATSPTAALFAAQKETELGTELLAVKLLHGAVEKKLVVGLQQRAGALAALQHRHIVTPHQVLDVGGKFGLVSPFVDGIDLLEWVEVLRENDVRMPPRVVCELLRGIAVALDAALHRVPWGHHKPLKFIHADLKPTNVMITRDGEVKVLDFGTGASQFEGRTEVPTRTARNYLSPERHLGRPPTPASDVYALGVLGIELLHDSWLHIIPSAPVEHDKHLTEVLRASEFKLRSSADQQTLRSLLLRMARHSPGSRPTAGVVAQTLRRLADRAPGPSLESFGHENATPWLMTIPEDPETALIVQVAPVPLEPLDLPEGDPSDLDSISNTLTNTDLSPLVTDDPSAVFLRGGGSDWDDGDESETQSIALKTDAALRARRDVLEDDNTVQDTPIRGDVSDDAPTQMPELDDPSLLATVTNVGAPPVVEDVEPEWVPSPPPPTSTEVLRYEDVKIQEAVFEEEEEVSIAWVALVATGTGCVSFGAVMAVLVGIVLGLYFATFI